MAIAWLVGCQVIVGSDLPDFTCTGDDPGNCPTGLTCDRGRCVAGDVDGGRDQLSPVSDASDASPDRRDAADPGFGKTCASDTDCPTDLVCGIAAVVSDTLVGSESPPFCTKPCCTSSDCPDSFVCYASGNGGNYCVSAKRFDLTPGATAAGRGCTADKDCRSGLCRQSVCVDACCGDANCAPGSICRKVLSDSPPLKKATWACGVRIPGADAAVGQECGGPSAATCPDGVCCENRNCSAGPLVCRPSCCTTAQCKSFGGEFAACAYINLSGGDGKTRHCVDEAAIIGDTATGGACTAPNQCRSFLCVEQKCAEPCCIDGDCAMGETCRPSALGQLRCVPKP